MKVGILTFHRCINYGSYWQARCLAEGLRAQGYDAELLDHDDPHVRRAEWRCAFQPKLPIRVGRADLARYGVKARSFLEAFERLPLSPRFPLHSPERAGDYDAVLVGSDEVWNFRHPWYGFKSIFFGDGIQTGRLAAYAASFGNHDADHGIDRSWAAKLDRFAGLSVRDENSRRLVSDSTGRDPRVVLDPCLQFPPEPVEGADEEAPYLLLYGHGFPEWFGREVRGWASRNGRRVISIGYFSEWADEQRIEASPRDFLHLMAGADAVATNFFHGCVFALLFARPFVTAPSAYRANKINDLTRLLSAERHVVGPQTASSDYETLLGEAVSPVIGQRIAARREQSAAYLAQVLG